MDTLYALKSPEGMILPWSITYSHESTKKKTNRWSGWDDAAKSGYKIVEVEITEIKP